MRGTLNLVLALPAEASPIIRHFELHPSINKSFKIYTNDNSSIRLIISGIGKLRAETAVLNMGKQYELKNSAAWLNIGIAGHIKRPIGSMVAAHKITDQVANRSWYPPMILNFPCDTASVLTVNKEIKNYPDEELVEMEAAGFYSAAEVFSSHELIHCLKLISDNSLDKKFDSNSVKKMIDKQCDNIESIVNQLLQLSSQLQELEAPTHKLKEFLLNWHFTVTQKYELEKILRRWSIIFPDIDPLKIVINECKISRDVIRVLRNELNNTTVDIASF